MFAKLIGWFAPYLIPAAGAVLVFALLFGGSQMWLKNRAKADLRDLQQVIATERAMAQAAAAAAQAEYRETERQWIEAVQEGQHAIEQAQREFKQATATLRAAATADARILRERLAAATGGGQAPGNPGSTGGGDAAACGDLLASALQVAGECTAGAESHLDAARTLLRAWPR